MPEEQLTKVTAEHLAILRNAVVTWVPFESGAPVLEPEKSFGGLDEQDDRAEIVEFLCGLLGCDADGADAEHVLKLRSEMGDVLAAFLEKAHLEPGLYSCPNVFEEDSIEVSGFDYELPIDLSQADVEFEVTNLHLKLLRAARVEWLDQLGTAGINFKRPYGDMTFHELDMAEILHVPFERSEDGQPDFTEEQFSFFDRLHRETLFALQMFLRHAEIAAN